jgi:hypothetical protein
MAGYAAMARVSSVDVRPRPWDGPVVPAREAPPAAGAGTTGAVVEDAWVDGLAERLSRIRDAWSMTIFFVTDAESWR